MKGESLVKKIISVLSILLLLGGSVAPDSFHIPIFARPWMFIFTVAWIVLLASGVFSS